MAAVSSKLRVLMIAPSAVAGGAEDVLFNLTMTLPSLDIDPEVIALQSGPLVERLARHAVPVEVIDAGRLRDARRFVLTCRRLANAIRSRNVHVVVSNLPKAHLYTAFSAVNQNTPTLWFQAGYPDPPHWIDRLASALPATGVITVSRDAAAAQQRLNRRRAVHLMHPGIDLAPFRVANDPELREQHDIPLDRVLISLVGRLQPDKGQRQFLHAAALLSKSHPEAHFAVVGGAVLGWEGDYPEELRRLTASLGIDERVTFTGHSSEVSRWMAASDIVVNPSEREGFGLVIVEAMAAGCAVVSSAKGGPPDIIEDGVSGLLCPTQEPPVLAAAIGRLLDDADLRRSIGRAARARVEAQFSREAMAERFANIMRAVA
jgi:glycosyltransferase involved in cell wall biosynthesis